MSLLGNLSYRNKEYKVYKKFDSKKEAEQHKEDMMNDWNSSNSRRFPPITNRRGKTSLKKYAVYVPIGWVE